MIARPESIGQAWRILHQMEGEIKELKEEIFRIHNPHSGEECNCTPCSSLRNIKQIEDAMRGFCASCGATIPHRYGEGRCHKCIQHFDEVINTFVVENDT